MMQAPYGRKVDPPFSVTCGRAVFHRVGASRAGLAPRLQLDRLKTAQALPQLALTLNEGEKRRFVRVGFEVVKAEIVLVDGGHGLKCFLPSC